jgi:hypothetical protein
MGKPETKAIPRLKMGVKHLPCCLLSALKPLGGTQSQCEATEKGLLVSDQTYCSVTAVRQEVILSGLCGIIISKDESQESIKSQFCWVW